MKVKESYGFLCLLAALVFGDGLHWFITPHPEASRFRMWAVAAQVVLALALAVFSYVKLRRATRAAA